MTDTALRSHLVRSGPRPSLGRQAIAWAAVAVLIVTSTIAAVWQTAAAQSTSDATPEERVVITFATTDDFPPFNARDEEGSMVGFNIDLARALCLELELTCEVNALPWSALWPAVKSGQVDAVIAAHRINVQTLAEVDFTQPYFHTPGRFAGRRDGPNLTITPTGLDRRKIGVAKGTAHEAFVQTFFRTSEIIRFDTPELARIALLDRKVDLIFGDGISLVFWINGSLSAGCCDLAGGAYLEPMFFGDGIGIAVKKGNRRLRVDLDAGLEQLRANGRMVELMQRYFPRQIY